jgi:hypothetical protein
MGFDWGSHFWHSAFIWATLVAAVCGGVGVGAAFIAGMVGYQVTEFSLQKGRDAVTDANERISEARIDADKKIAFAREEAKVEVEKAHAEIAKANVEIETAKRDAENARLEQERLKAQLAWRTIEPRQLEMMRANLADARGTVFLEYAENDPEAIYFSIQIANLFNDRARWQVGVGTVAYPTALVFGLFIRGSEGNETLRQIRSAFTAAGIGFSSDPPPNVSMMTRSGSAPLGNEDALISIGSKRPPL